VHVPKSEYSGFALGGGNEEIDVAHAGREVMVSPWTTSKVLYLLESRVVNMPLSWHMWSEAQESTPKPLSKDGVTAPPATALQFKLR
jgi:hypothetical protein